MEEKIKSSQKSSKVEMKDKPKHFELIVKQRWRKLSHFLNSRKGNELIRERDGSNLNCLSLSLGYQAPIEIIEKMIQMDPQLALEKDSFGATSLHVACLNGTPVNLVNVLLQHHHDLAYEVDLDHRGPLHHAVEYACEREVSHHDDYTHDTYIDVIHTVCKAAPEMLYCCDNMGETPIDAVQVMKAKCKESGPRYEKLQLIYLELTDQSIQLYRENKRRWELEGYMTKLCLEQSMEPSVPSVASTLKSNGSSVMTPSSEGRNLMLDSASYQRTECNDKDCRERTSNNVDLGNILE